MLDEGNPLVGGPPPNPDMCSALCSAGLSENGPEEPLGGLEGRWEDIGGVDICTPCRGRRPARSRFDRVAKSWTGCETLKAPGKIFATEWGGHVGVAVSCDDKTDPREGGR